MRHLPLVGVAAYVALVFGTTVHAQQPAPPPAPLPEYGSTVTLEQADEGGQCSVGGGEEIERR